MVFGRVDQELLQVNDDTFWTGSPSYRESIKSDGPKTLPKIRQLILDEKLEEVLITQTEVENLCHLLTNVKVASDAEVSATAQGEMEVAR